MFLRLTFASYLGGNGNDAAYVLSLGPGRRYLCSWWNRKPFVNNVRTNSFPGNHAGTVGGVTPLGGIDGFVAQISNNGTNTDSLNLYRH